MPAIYDSPSGRAGTRPRRTPKRKVTYAPQIKARPKVVYAPQIRATRKPAAPPRNADTGDRARSRPKPKVIYAPQIKAVRKPITHQTPRPEPAPKRKVTYAPQIKKPIKRDPDGPFTKHPVQGMLAAEKRTVGALSELHAQDPEKYDRELQKGLKHKSKALLDQQFKQAEHKRQLESASPAAMKILGALQTPLHAEAGAVSAALKGKNPLKGAKQSVKKDHKTFGTVLREHHVPKKIAGPVGTVADIGLDVTTYATLGRGTLAKAEIMGAKKTAEKAASKAAETTATTQTTARLAAEKAEKAAIRAGEEKAAAKQVGERAAKRAKRQVVRERGRVAGEAAARRSTAKVRPARHHTKGITVSLAGKRIPGVTAATGTGAHVIKHGVRKATPKVLRVRAGQGARALARTFHPSTRPHGISEAEHAAGREIVGKAQATKNAANKRSVIVAQALQHIPASQHEAFIKALETKRLAPLADNAAEVAADKKATASAGKGGRKPSVKPTGALYTLAIRTRAELDHELRKGRRAGEITEKVGDTRRYLTNAQLDSLKQSVGAEQRTQRRVHESAKKGARAAAAQHAVAEEAARGSAALKAGVATERQRGQARTATVVGNERARREASTETEKSRRKVTAANETAKRQAAVATERARGQSRTEARAEQHAASIEFERAHAGARVSAANKISPELRKHLRTHTAAKTAHGTAKTALRRAEGHLQRTLAKPKTQPRHVASAYAKVVRAKRRVEGTGQAVATSRTAVNAERRRVAGVAPEQAQRLLDANAAKGRVKPKPVARIVAGKAPHAPRVVSDRPAQLRAHRAASAAERREVREAPTPARKVVAHIKGLEAKAEREQALGIPHVERVVPEAPSGRRLDRALSGIAEREADVGAARARREAAGNVPAHSLLETHEQFLRRVVEHATTHDLPLVRKRAEKLLEAKPSKTAKGYFPRDFDDRVLQQLGIKPKDLTSKGASRASAVTQRKVTKITSGYKRANQQRLDVVNPKRETAGQEPFSTNVPLVIANHLRRVGRATSESEMFRELAAIGRPVRSAAEVKEGEQLYRLGRDGNQFSLTPVSHVPSRISQAPSKGGAMVELPEKAGKHGKSWGGQYVALNPRLVDEVAGASAPITKTKGGEIFDAATGAFKRTAIATIGFHVRNAIGDIQQAYYQVAGHALPGALKGGFTAAVRARELDGSIRAKASEKTINVAGEAMPVDEFIAGARKHGVLDSGWFGGELDQMARPSERLSKVRGGKVVKGKQALDRWMTARENMMRLGSYKVGLDNGLTQAQAAAFSKKLHIDYSDLSEFERVVMRRAMPFYTWTARSLPLAAETLITRPGKFANLEKIRRGISDTFSDLPEDERNERMTEAVLRQLPVTVKIGGEDKALSFSAPATLLNELPAGVSKDAAGAWQKELGRLGWGMTNPIPRAVTEWGAQRSMVTKADIENKDRPLTAAPAWVKYAPARLKQALDITPGVVDPKTGRKGYAWRGRADWAYDQVMLGWYGQAAQLAGSGRTPGTARGPAIAGALGLRVDPLNPNLKKRATEAPIRNEKERLERKRAILNSQGINRENPTPEWTRLSKRINELDKKVNPPKAKKKAGGGFDGGSGMDSGASGFGASGL